MASLFFYYFIYFFIAFSFMFSAHSDFCHPFCSFRPSFHLIWCHPRETHLPRMHEEMFKTQACCIIKITWTVWSRCQCARQIQTSSRQQAHNMSQPVATYCRNATSKCWTFRKKTYTGKHSFWEPSLCQKFPCTPVLEANGVRHKNVVWQIPQPVGSPVGNR